MLLPILLLLADPETAVDAERAFARAAQTAGQWTAFREFAAPSAIMFDPQPVPAQDWLKDRKDPASSIEWWPTESYQSCDGKMAVNHGGWKRADGAVGYFSTVWQHMPDGKWKWIMDGGDATKTALPRPDAPRVVRAACNGKPTVIDVERKVGRKVYMGQSSDKSLAYIAFVYPDGRRHFSAALWTGTSHDIVVRDEIEASAK